MDDRVVEFICPEEWYGEAAEPYPANNNLPEWYKDLEPAADGGDGGFTVKRCMSFLDAMTMGWILPMPFDVHINVHEERMAMEVTWDNEFDVFSKHATKQLGGGAHPEMKAPIVKFETPWVMRTPEGVSTLITDPMNRADGRFKGFSGVIETDGYYSNILLPCLWTEPGYEGTIEKGTPLLQAIPFSRDGIVGDGVVREMNEAEAKKQHRFQKLLDETEGLYRNALWEAKNQARVVNPDE